MDGYNIIDMLLVLCLYAFLCLCMCVCAPLLFVLAVCGCSCVEYFLVCTAMIAVQIELMMSVMYNLLALINDKS